MAGAQSASQRIAIRTSARGYRGHAAGRLSSSCANIVRLFPCPGAPMWNTISAGPKEIYEPANSAIEQAYLKDKGSLPAVSRPETSRPDISRAMYWKSGMGDTSNC